MTSMPWMWHWWIFLGASVLGTLAARSLFEERRAQSGDMFVSLRPTNYADLCRWLAMGALFGVVIACIAGFLR